MHKHHKTLVIKNIIYDTLSDLSEQTSCFVTTKNYLICDRTQTLKLVSKMLSLAFNNMHEFSQVGLKVQNKDNSVLQHCCYNKAVVIH